MQEREPGEMGGNLPCAAAAWPAGSGHPGKVCQLMCVAHMTLAYHTALGTASEREGGRGGSKGWRSGENATG